MINKAFSLKLNSLTATKTESDLADKPETKQAMTQNDAQQMRQRLVRKKHDALQAEHLADHLLNAVNENEARLHETKSSNQIEQMITELHDQRNLINYDPRTYTVADLVKFNEQQRLLPEIATAEWSKTKQSRFIESILLGIPVPALYLTLIPNCPIDHDRFLVTDGQERLKALTDFKQQKLELTGLTVLKSFNHKYQRELSMDANYKLDRTMLTTIVLYDDTKHQINAEIAQRLNN